MKIFVKDTTYLAEPGSLFTYSVKIDGDFIVPQKTHFWKDLVVTGHLSLGAYSRVYGNVSCNGAVISRGCLVEGELNAETEQLTVCDGARVRIIRSKGNILLRPGIVSDEVHGENILVMGKIHCRKLVGRNTRIITN
ncbi:MAG TPA: polymer-forming cytoskeletal protein [Methanocorpusculum sp.]|nr:polymer-forming cytoskeletal protein [Methanocorpusculum sp.]